MTSEESSTTRWRRLQEVLDGALELSAEEQLPFIERACTTDPVLRDEARELLAACRRAGDFLEHAPGELTSELFESLAPAHGARIGPYRLIDEAGRGGMGIVYRAVRDDGHFDQRVALKLVPHGFDPDNSARRVREERRILAGLNHPDIARLIDGGVTDDGQPWFAMEYVEGTPIDMYCNERCLGIEARLALFVRVVDAVHYAHQNLVVHRDLKPSNILVAADGTGAKLLDFGVATILAPDGDDARERTLTASRWFTPYYASPEQVCGGPITTASDVYSLGVVLYELLAGERPHRITSMAPAALAGAICDTEPERPSAVALRNASAMTTHGLRAERLSRRLRGDLDTIVRMAMHREPARRYPSAESFADDLRRHLAGHPVRARPDSLVYRTSSFVRRHRYAVAASAGLVLSLIGGAAGTTWQARAAARQRDNARQEAATAGQVSSLLVDMFRLSEGDSARGSTVTAREMLAQGARRIQTEFASQPLLQASLLRELGTIYQNLGLHGDAERFLRQAATIWRRSDRRDELARALDQLGQISLTRGQFDTAQAHLREALGLYESLDEPPLARIAVSLGHLGDVLNAQRQYAPAESLFRASLALNRQLHGPRHPEVAAMLFDLAGSLHDRGKFSEAEPLFAEALSIYRSLPGTPGPEAAAALGMLGAVHLFREEYDKAEPLLREALTVRRALYQNDHPSVVDALTALGTLFHNTSRFDEAERMLSEAIKASGAFAGASHPQAIQTRLVLAGTYREQGRYPEALRILTEVLDASRTGAGTDQPISVYVRQLRGETELALGKVDDAEATFDQVVAEGLRLFGAEHPYIALGMRGQARVELERGRADSAEARLRRALAMVEGKVRPNHRYLLGIRKTLAEALGAQGRYAEASTLYADVLAIERANLPPRHVALARTLHGYGALHLTMGNAVAAESLLREAIAIRRVRHGDHHGDVAESAVLLGASLAALGRQEAAEPLLRDGYQVLRAVRGENDPGVRRAWERLRIVRRQSAAAANRNGLTTSGSTASSRSQ